MATDNNDNSNCCPCTSTGTYLTIGQDYESIQEYVRNVMDPFVELQQQTISTIVDIDETSTPLSKTPTIYMVYTDLQELRGLYSPIDYGGGIQYANGLLSTTTTTSTNNTTNTSQPSAVSVQLQIGLWLNGTNGCRDIINGQLQDQIQQLFHYCLFGTKTTTTTTTTTTAAVHHHHHIYLRIGYEFDNPAFGYSTDPSLYVQAFQYIVNQCYTLYSYTTCRNHIDFVWHSWAASLLPPTSSLGGSVATTTTTTTTVLEDYYPGDDYVDWVGISVFSQLYTETTKPALVTQLGNRDTVQYVCDFAVQHNKSILIAESTPFGGIDQMQDPWNDWFEPVLQLIEQYHSNLHMWSYIYCDWDRIPMWNHTGFGNSRLEYNTTVLQLWYQHVLENPQFQRNNCHNHYDANCIVSTTNPNIDDRTGSGSDGRSATKPKLLQRPLMVESMFLEESSDSVRSGSTPNHIRSAGTSWILVHVGLCCCLLAVLLVAVRRARRGQQQRLKRKNVTTHRYETETFPDDDDDNDNAPKQQQIIGERSAFQSLRVDTYGSTLRIV